LEILDRLLRLRPEVPIDIVGCQDLHTSKDPLNSLHVVSGVAQLDGRRHVVSPIGLLLAQLLLEEQPQKVIENGRGPNPRELR